MERGKILVKNQKEALAGPDPPPWFHFSIFTDQHTRQKMVALWTVTHKHVKQKILVHTHTHILLAAITHPNTTHTTGVTAQNPSLDYYKQSGSDMKLVRL